MLQALTKFFRRTRDSAQLEFPLSPGGSHDLEPRPSALADADELLARLVQLGLKRITRARLTRNRNVMVSFGGGALRIHEGYLAAPEIVLRAIVTFVEGRTRAARRAAERAIIAHPVVTSAAPARRERTHTDDNELVAQLQGWHERYNARHFGGALRPVTMRVSRRMKSRLGHYGASAGPGELAEIAISRSHLRRHGWAEALHTLLHEMVHQWQDETGRTIDHGPTFRAKAREVGIAPYARRVLTRTSRGAPKHPALA